MKNYKVILDEKRNKKKQIIESIILNKALIKQMYDTEPKNNVYVDLNISKDIIKKKNRI